MELPILPKADLNLAIDKATHLFWENGYGATTMRQLQQAMDMRPGSIYASFGDKDSLYLRALERYKSQSLLNMQTTMAAAMTAKEGLITTIKTAVIPGRQCASALCFLVKTVNELETRQPELVSYAKSALGEVKLELARQIALVLKEQGEQEHLIGDRAKQLALPVQAQIMGLKAQLKVTGDQAMIIASVAPFIDALFGKQ